MKTGLLILSSNKHPTEMDLYELKQTEDEVYLFYSKCDKGWTQPGNPAYTLINTHNDFIFIDHHMKTKVRIDYCQAQALRALLKLEDSTGATFNLYEKK